MPNEDQTGNAGAIARSNGQFACKYVRGGCERYGVEICIQCRQLFCPDHASVIDPKFCCDCLKPQDALVERLPLKDVDGVTHTGALIHPTGPAYKTLTQRISEMTDNQLSLHIQDIRVKVREAETVLDHRRIDLTVSELEEAERGEARRRQLRKSPAIKQVTVIANGKSADGDTTKTKKLQDTMGKLQMLAKLMGIELRTSEDMAKFATMLSEKVKAGKK
jgi:hypothetical protein